MPNNTKEILKKYNIRLDKNKSQNYLINENKLKNIMENADIHPDETILEIGAGIGTLTIPLSRKASKVIAIEKDPYIAEVLQHRITEEKINNIEIINEDALKIEYPPFDKIVSNLPYQISSPVTFKLLKYDFKKAILMYQLEFAKRMNAKADTKEYSRLSVALYYRADIRIIDTLSPEAFIPQPRVNSAVIELIPKKEVELNDYFDDVARALFQHRNKKARKALIQSAHELNCEKKKMKLLLEEVENDLLDEKVFKLSPEQILELSELVGELI
ncbi:MAG: 16S rRNA (adenine(1518)-N(6)/adenine(1519)-N(6))-dimethyltransferase [Methanosphaera sp. rholeuAM270]|nr:MAG: 16S rRNA (adenine(1518)-N(6)/adenine(1519)-N(6))-dimethyltransferase [Methanosphaera sp. rholeuAM270]